MKEGLRRIPIVAIALALAGLWIAAAAKADPFAYVTNARSGNVSQYDASGGALAALSPPTVSAVHPFPLGIAATPDGKSVFVGTNEDYGTPAREADLLQYSVGAGGALALRGSIPLPPDADPGTMEVSPDGRTLYVINLASSGSVIEYSVGANDQVTPDSPSEVATRPGPTRLAVSPDSRSVYVTNSVEGDNSVSQFTAAADGTLTPKSPSTVPVRQTPTDSLVDVVVSPDGHSVYVTNFQPLIGLDGSVAQFSVGPDGALTPKSPPFVGAAMHPFGLAVSPDSRSVYATDALGNRLLQYSAGQDGGLTPKQPAAVGAGTSPLGIAINADGRSIFAANAGDDTISQYSVGAGGVLSPRSPATAPTGRNPVEIAVIPPSVPTVPITVDQCRNGGWSRFGFRSEGRCIAFVLLGRICGTLERHGIHLRVCPPAPPRRA